MSLDWRMSSNEHWKWRKVDVHVSHVLKITECLLDPFAIRPPVYAFMPAELLRGISSLRLQWRSAFCGKGRVGHARLICYSTDVEEADTGAQAPEGELPAAGEAAHESNAVEASPSAAATEEEPEEVQETPEAVQTRRNA